MINRCKDRKTNLFKKLSNLVTKLAGGLMPGSKMPRNVSRLKRVLAPLKCEGCAIALTIHLTFTQIALGFDEANISSCSLSQTDIEGQF